MGYKRSDGFIETILLVAVFWGLAATGILRVTPQLKSLAFSSIESHIVSPTPIPDSNALRFDHALGIQLNDSTHLEVQLNNERMSVPLIGLDNSATQSGDIRQTLQNITHNIRGETLYMIYFATTKQIDGVYPRYVFLDDGTSLNSYVIAQGLAHASTEPHPYLADFSLAQEHARNDQKGVWAEPTPILSPTRLPTEQIVTRVPTLTPIPTITKAPTSKPTISYRTPTPLPPVNLNPYLTSTSSATTQPTSLNSEIIFAMINDYRKSKSLAPFEKDAQLCSLAQLRAPELYNEIFVTGHIHEGFYSRNIPYWITENMASYPTEEFMVKWWLNSPIHRSAIEGNYTYSCGACSGTSCTQLFTSYVPKQ